MYNIAVMFTFALLDIVPAEYDCEPRDCYDLKCFGVSKAKDGPHTIYLAKTNLTSLQVSCDQETDNGGWIMYQRRVDGTVNFARNWQDYKHGFGTNGDATTELWLGNENVYQILQSYGNMKCELRIEADAFDGTSCWVEVDTFRMHSEALGYKIVWVRVFESESGIAENWNFHELLTFKTKDKPDGRPKCLREYKGGWWYGKGCARIFLNGVYVKQADSTSKSIAVRSFKFQTALQRSRMMFRPSVDRPCYNPCGNGGTCEHVTNPKRRRCRCTSKFCGDKCEVVNPCENNGICEYVAVTKTNRCKCTSNFCGASCELPNPCQNNGTCEYDTTTNSTTCKCTSGFSGPICGDATSAYVLPPAIIAVVVGLLLLLLLIVVAVCIGVISDRRRKKKRLEQRQLADLEMGEVMGGFFTFFGL